MIVAMGVAIGLVALTAVVATIRILTAPGDADRAVVADLVYFCAVAVFVLFGALSGSALVFDIALIGGLLGILTTVALARMVGRGER